MKQSQLFAKTSKQVGAEETSINAQFLIRAGFIDKLAAGVYTFLPLGLIVLRKIENVVRKAMNAAGSQEVLMTALIPKENWLQTDRWDNFDVLYKLEGSDGKEYALGSTHEEVVTPLVQKYARSYRDFPISVYQIQTKFRNEKRAKAGLLRGREFLMKDAYSFHRTPEDFDAYYNKMSDVYTQIYKDLGIGDITYKTFALGGSFSKYSHEFQTICENGEDLIFICNKCKTAINREVIEADGEVCVNCGGKEFTQKKAIEVGNIFSLKDRFSTPFKFTYLDQDGKLKPVLMGCYGIGISRLMGTIAEVYHDESGLIWPKEIAPFSVHLVSLGISETVKMASEELYVKLQKQGIEVLYDDRDDSAGAKLKDSDLIGIPARILISEKTLGSSSVEFKARNKPEAEMINIDTVISRILA